MNLDERDTPFLKELNGYIKSLLGIRQEFISRSYKWDCPLRKADNLKEILWCDNEYLIVFFGTGILIHMNEFMLEKITILNSILLKQNGSDKALRLNYMDSNTKVKFNGPQLFITNLHPESLLFDNPTSENKVEITRLDNIKLTEKGFFKQKNLAEALYHCNWYQ